MTKTYDHLEILNSFPDAVSIKDLEFRFVWVNKTITDILGIPLDQIVGKKCYELAYGLSEPCDGCPALVVVETGKQARNEIATVRGKVMDAIVDPIFDENGILIQTIETSRNVTDQKLIETRYSHFMSSATDGFSIFDKDLNYVDANQTSLNRIGLSRDELIGKNLAEVFPEAEKKGRIAKYREVIERGEPVFFDSISENRAGQPNVFSISAFKVGTGLGIIITDITNVKRLEESLRKSEAYYRAIFENTGTALIIIEADAIISRVNKRFETLTGYSRSEVEGLMNWAEFVTPEYLETMKQYSVDRRNGKPVPLEYPCDIVNKAGHVKHVHISVEVIPETRQSAVSVLDITDRVQIEERYRSLFDSLIDGFAYHQAVYNENGEPVNYTYIEINDRFTELIGLGRDILGKNVTEVLPGIEDDPADWIGVYGELAKNGGELRFEQYAEPLGKWFSISAYSPKPGYFATIFQDITEQHKQKEHIAYLNQILLAIRNVNQLIVTEKDRDVLLRRSCELMVADKGYIGAWIALKTTDGPVSDVYGVGYGEKFNQFRENMLQGHEYPCLTRIGIPGVQVISDPSTFCEGCILFEHDHNMLCTTLQHEDNVFGMFVASVSEGMTGETERELFREVADDIAFALHGLDLEDARTKAEKALEKRSHDLGERVKEMTCLYLMETLASNHTQALPVVIQSIVELLPPAWQYPEETSARITIRDHVHQTENYVETDWSQKETIVVNGETTGYVTVCYRSEMPPEDEGPFLRQERDLIQAVALKTGEIIGLRALEKRAERSASKLRESEALFRGFMQSATERYNLFDEEMRFIEVNDSWLQNSKLEREDVIGKHVLEVFPRLAETERYKEYLEVLETGKPVQFSAVVPISASGEIVDITAFKTGDYLGLVARDVSDHIRHQRRLETLHGHAAALSSAESLKEVSEITRDSLNEVIGFFEGGLGIIEDEKLVYEHLWGAEIMEPFTMPLNGTGVSVEVVNSGVAQNIGDVRENPVFFDGLGTMKTVSELAVPVIVSGKTVGVVNVESEDKDAFSVNDQRLVETLASHIASAYSNIKYLERLDALHGFTVELGITESVQETIDTSLRIMSQVLGFRFSSFQLLEDQNLVMVGADGSTGVWDPLPLSGKGITTRAAREAQAIRVGDIRLNPDFIQGSTDSLSELAVPMVVENRVMGVLNVESLELDAFTDEDTKLLEMLASNVGSALHRIRAAEEKADLESELFTERIRGEQEQELSRLKTRFMSTATHEIRTPLSSILGYTELIQMDEGNLSETQRRYFEVILRNVNRLTVLTDDLLDLQRLEEGRLAVNIEPVNIRDMVDGVESEFAPILAEKGQVLEVSCIDIVVNIDQLRVMQVLVNLLANASKFSPEGSEITVDVVETGDGVLVSVSDNGIGLSEEDLGKLFTPFPGILVDGNVSGTGLGLSICKGIVELHGGTLWAESDGIGCGSVFRFTLPTAS